MVRIAVLSLLFYAGACKTDVVDEKGVNGVLKDQSGLDGCGWIIEVNDNGSLKKYEPYNLSEFDINPEDGMKVRFEYESASEMASICMVGEIIKLNSIEEK